MHIYKLLWFNSDVSNHKTVLYSSFSFLISYRSAFSKETKRIPTTHIKRWVARNIILERKELQKKKGSKRTRKKRLKRISRSHTLFNQTTSKSANALFKKVTNALFNQTTINWQPTTTSDDNRLLLNQQITWVSESWWVTKSIKLKYKWGKWK